MKIMIRTDMEGASGIVSYSQAEAGCGEYAVGQRYFVSDLLSLLRGLEGAEIYLYDEHFYGRNIPLDALPRGVTLYCGKPPYRADWAGGLDASFDGMVMLGFHSKAGTEQALLAHSYESDILDIRVNGLSVGEIGVETMIAGELGVPLVLVTGDDKGCEEAGALVPGVSCVTVKRGQGMYGAQVYPLQDTSGWIEEAARKLARGVTRLPKPYATPKNPVMEITLTDTPYRAALAKLFPDVCRGRAVTLQGSTVCAVWSQYWRMKLAAQDGMEKKV